MKKFSDGMKEDSDRIYKYSLINLAITFLPPDLLQGVEVSGVTLTGGGLEVLQKVTALILVAQAISLLVSLLSNRHEIISESSEILSDMGRGETSYTKNIHSGKNYYERTYLAAEWLRSTIFLIQAVVPFLICALCIYFSFIWE